MVYLQSILYIYKHDTLNPSSNNIKWVSDCCLMPKEQFFIFIIERTSYISIKWWCLLCTIPKCLVGFL
jgi:hypothetical protein